MVKDNVDAYLNHSIPLEGVWLDIPYMDTYHDFRVDTTAFGGLKAFARDIRNKHGMKLIPIVDAGLSADGPEIPYVEDAMKRKTLLLDGDTPFYARVWPLQAAFLDWFNADQAKWVWGGGLSDLQAEFEYDGLWLDMNEATIFCNGGPPLCHAPTRRRGQADAGYAQVEERRRLKDEPKDTQHQPQDDDGTWYTTYDASFWNGSSTYYLPFIPMRYNLDNMSMKLNLTHPASGFTQYDTHSLFGHMEAK